MGESSILILIVFLKIFSFILILFASFIVFLISSYFFEKYGLKIKGKKFYFPFLSITLSSILFPSIYTKDQFQWLIYLGGISSIFLIFYINSLKKGLLEK